ncbi:MAG: glycosyltransferase family 1 protein, partial [Gammaproteobacteria bacterium]
MAARLYRLGWAGTYRLGLSTLKYFLERDKLRGKALFINFASRVKPLKNTKKYFDDPRQMLGGIIIILKVPSGNERGVLLLKYSYYFLLFLEFYDVARIQERYNIILEPSWAGFCDETIMAYTQLPEPVFVQVYERRDRRLIDALDVNLIPLDVGPSWFVDHEVFSPPLPSEKRDIDIIMVASWSTFKRHDAVFEVLSVLRERKPDLSIALVGYPGDLTKDDIAQMASRRGLTMGLSFYEWITPSEVAQVACFVDAGVQPG